MPGLRRVVREVREGTMTTNDIRKASLWHVLWSRYPKSSYERVMPGLKPSTGAGARWCGRRCAVTCVRGDVGGTSRIGPRSRGPCVYKRRPGGPWKVRGTMGPKPCVGCATGSIDLPVRGGSPRHLRRDQVVRHRGGLGKGSRPPAGAPSGRSSALCTGCLVDGIGERPALRGTHRREDTARSGDVLRARRRDYTVQPRRLELGCDPQPGARPRRLRRLLPRPGPSHGDSAHHRRPQDALPPYSRGWRPEPRNTLTPFSQHRFKSARLPTSTIRPLRTVHEEWC